MAKKAATGIMAIIGEVVTFFSDTVIRSLSDRINDETDAIMNKVEKRALKLQEAMTKRLAASLIIGAAIVALFLSGMFFLFEYLQVTKTLAFLALGMALLIIGLFLKNKQATERDT